MKKQKKSKSAISHKSSSLKKKITSAPPDNFINELVHLFNTGDFDLIHRKANEAIKKWPKHPLGWKALGNLFLMQGKMQEAINPLSKTVELNPDDFQAFNNLGIIFLEMRQLEKAEQNFRQAIRLNPNYTEALNNLGITLLKLGSFEESKASLQKAIDLNPDFAQAYNNLGNVFKELGKIKEAETSYKKAIDLNLNSAEVHCNLAYIYMELGQIGNARSSYRQALAINPDYEQAHSGLGDVNLKRGKLRESIQHYRKSIDLDPHSIKSHDGFNKALSNLVPPWHVPMMNDKPRNDAYFAAMQNAVTPDTHVLEIGTGSGLLAMMAARLGSGRVTTCETVPEIAETAEAIIKDNDLSSQITVIPKNSNKMIIGEDMDERADLLVSEILSSEFLGEAVFSSVEDAKRRLLKPNAQIIPARGSIQIALFGGEDIEKNIRVDEVYGFDLSRFNEIVANKQYNSRQDLNIELLSDDICAFFFDFAKIDRTPYNEQKNIEILVTQAGRCCGLIQWLRLEMDDNIVFENHPSTKNPSMGWQHCMYIFPKPVIVKPGLTVSITAAHNRNTPWFFYQGVTEQG